MTTLQVVVFILFSIGCDYIAAKSKLPLPGSLLGMFLLFILLKGKIVKLSWIEEGGNWLLSYMLLFFVPPMLGVVDYKDMVMEDGLKFLFIIIAGNICVMTISGFIMEKLMRKRGEQV